MEPNITQISKALIGINWPTLIVFIIIILIIAIPVYKYIFNDIKKKNGKKNDNIEFSKILNDINEIKLKMNSQEYSLREIVIQTKNIEDLSKDSSYKVNELTGTIKTFIQMMD